MPGRVLFASVVSAWALAVLYWGCGGTPPPTADPPSAVAPPSIEILGLKPELRRTAMLVILIPDLLRLGQQRLVE